MKGLLTTLRNMQAPDKIRICKYYHISGFSDLGGSAHHVPTQALKSSKYV